MKRFELYSDASFDADTRIGAWSYVLLKNDEIFSQNTGWFRVKNAFYAEIRGLYEGVLCAPRGSKLTIHTDIRALKDIFGKGYKSKHHCVKSVLERLSSERIEAEISFERMRQDRSEWYWLCDRRSNLLLKANVGRGGCNLGERK